MVESRKDKAERVEEASKFWTGTLDSLSVRAKRIAQKANPHDNPITNKNRRQEDRKVVQFPLSTKEVVAGLAAGTGEGSDYWKRVQDGMGKSPIMGDIIDELGANRAIRRSDEETIPEDLLDL